MNSYNVRFTSRSEVDHLVKAHYLGKWPGVVVGIVGLFESDRAIGVIVFALPPRETLKRYKVINAWELARLFIEDCTPKNAETWFMSRAIKAIRKTRPDVELLVSYADPSAGPTGIIYRAGNWIPDGRTDQERKTPRCDYMVDGKKYSRKCHIPEGATWTRVPRVSKPRFIYWMQGHEKRRAEGAKK